MRTFSSSQTFTAPRSPAHLDHPPPTRVRQPSAWWIKGLFRSLFWAAAALCAGPLSAQAQATKRFADDMAERTRACQEGHPPVPQRADARVASVANKEGARGRLEGKSRRAIERGKRRRAVRVSRNRTGLPR